MDNRKDGSADNCVQLLILLSSSSYNATLLHFFGMKVHFHFPLLPSPVSFPQSTILWSKYSLLIANFSNVSLTFIFYFKFAFLAMLVALDSFLVINQFSLFLSLLHTLTLSIAPPSFTASDCGAHFHLSYSAHSDFSLYSLSLVVSYETMLLYRTFWSWYFQSVCCTANL